jgi:16S rRNA (guanine527-N7)-methyltransferase
VKLPPAATTRLTELADRHAVSPSGVRALATILALQASDPTASTTVRDPVAAVDRHVADSLVALELEPVRHAGRIADLGSGAGWPGLALAAALPHAHVALVESAIRRCRYLTRAVEVAGLTNCSVVNSRAEAWTDGIEAHDLVTARALAALPVVCEYAAPLLAVGGELVVWKGAVDPRETSDGAAAAAQLGLTVLAARPAHPYPGAREHTLHVFRKDAPTPARFPRRPGIAAKRPLSAQT